MSNSTITQFPTGAGLYRINFPYLARKFVVVSLVKTGSDPEVAVLNPLDDYKFVSDTSIEISKSMAGYDIVQIHRHTSSEPIVPFKDGSTLVANDLTTAEMQAIHIAEEGRDAIDRDLKPLVEELTGISSHALRVEDTVLTPLPNAADRAGKLVGFNDQGDAVMVLPESGSASDVMLQYAKDGGANLIGTATGKTVQAELDNFDGKLRNILSKQVVTYGYRLVDGGFRVGAELSTRVDVVVDESTGLVYTWGGTYPKTVSAGESPADAGWTQISFLTTFTVGNDESVPYYDYSELSDCLAAISASKAANPLKGNTTYRIVIPAGTHKFKALRMRGVNFSDVQIWGAGTAQTVIKCIPSNTTSGIWFESRFSSFGDIAGLRLEWDSGVTSTTDVAVSCVRWYGSGAPPWGDAPTANFFDLLSSTIGRVSQVLCVGDVSGTGVRLGSGFNVACSTIHQLDSIECRNIRDSYIFYNGSVIGSGYGSIKTTQGFNHIVNHESTVHIRQTAATAFSASGAVVREGSVFIDTMRGETTIAQIGAGESVSRFDTLFLMASGKITCQIPAANYSAYNKMMESFGSGSELYTMLTPRDENILLSDNTVRQLQVGITDINSTNRKIGFLTYTGNGATTGIDVDIPYGATSVTIYNRTTGNSLKLVLGQVSLTGTGTNSVWFNAANGKLRAYSMGPFNTSGVIYEVVWEK